MFQNYTRSTCQLAKFKIAINDAPKNLRLESNHPELTTVDRYNRYERQKILSILRHLPSKMCYHKRCSECLEEKSVTNFYC
jgi:hypothetical protein